MVFISCHMLFRLTPRMRQTAKFDAKDATKLPPITPWMPCNASWAAIFDEHAQFTCLLRLRWDLVVDN